MKEHNKLNKFLFLIKSFLLVLFFTLLIILILQLNSIKNSNNRTNTYIGWCKSAFNKNESRYPYAKRYKNSIKECVKGWKKIEKELKK